MHDYNRIPCGKPRSKPPRIITDTRIFDFEEDMNRKHFGVLDKASRMLCMYCIFIDGELELKMTNIYFYNIGSTKSAIEKFNLQRTSERQSKILTECTSKSNNLRQNTEVLSSYRPLESQIQMIKSKHQPVIK